MMLSWLMMKGSFPWINQKFFRGSIDHRITKRRRRGSHASRRLYIHILCFAFIILTSSSSTARSSFVGSWSSSSALYHRHHRCLSLTNKLALSWNPPPFPDEASTNRGDDVVVAVVGLMSWIPQAQSDVYSEYRHSIYLLMHKSTLPDTVSRHKGSTMDCMIR